MSYVSILTSVESDSASSDARVALAASLARRFKARLIGVAAAAVQSIPVMDATGAAMVNAEMFQAEEDRLVADLKAAGAAFMARSDLAGIDCEWRSDVYFPAEVLAREARAADIVVVGRDKEIVRRGAYQSIDPGEIILAAGRPVLIVPPGTRAITARHVVVGWKDTREARRAVADALPFLREAEVVEVIGVAAGDDEAEAAARHVDDVVRFLNRHRARGGTKARIAREKEAAAADALILAAQQAGADLIVAGGYGYSRLTEWIFGGVTRDLLKRCPVCCLLSH